MCQMHLTDSFSTKFGFKNVPKLQNLLKISKDPIGLCQIHPKHPFPKTQGAWPMIRQQTLEIPGFQRCPVSITTSTSWGVAVVHGGLYRRFIPQTYVPSVFPGDQPICQFLRPSTLQKKKRDSHPYESVCFFQGQSYSHPVRIVPKSMPY